MSKSPPVNKFGLIELPVHKAPGNLTPVKGIQSKPASKATVAKMTPNKFGITSK